MITMKRNVRLLFKVEIELNQFLTDISCSHSFSVRPNLDFITEPQVITRQRDCNFLSMVMECNTFCSWFQCFHFKDWAGGWRGDVILRRLVNESSEEHPVVDLHGMLDKVTVNQY